MARAEVQAAIEQEIVAERAGALARAVEALEGALGDLAHHDALLELSGAPARERSDARADLVRAAGERLWYVVVHREALGIRRHEVLYEVLRVPTEVRAAMGPGRPRRSPPR